MASYYSDMPLPPRRSSAPPDKAPPRSFRAALTLTPSRDRLFFYAELSGTPAVYRGRGYFTEKPSDPPGAGFRVPQISLLDPFLWQYRTVSPQHFKIVLRVIVPKLQRDGVQLTCALSLTEDPPVRVDVTYDGDAEVFRLHILSVVPRGSLTALQGLDEYMLAENTLYRVRQPHLKELSPYPDGESTLPRGRAQALGRLCDRASYLFAGAGVPALRDCGRGIPLRTPQPASPYGRRPAPAPSPRPQEVPEIREAVFPPPSRPTPAPVREIALEPPALIRAVILPSAISGSVKTAVFLNDARRLRGYAVARASFVPFRAGRPTYADMNAAQKSWYFYWRAQFARGIVLKTDISYIYVAAYELLNSVTASGAEALSSLLRLWESYRGIFPYLDRCMPGWCADYMLLCDLGQDFDSLQERIPFSVTETDLPAEVFCSRRLREGLYALPLSVLGALGGYAIEDSRFCADPERRARCEAAVARALRAAEDVHRAKGTPLLDAYAPMQTTCLHDSFYGAVIGRASSRRIELCYRPYSRDPQFRTLLGAILRYTENLLRKREHFPGRLKAEALPADIEAAILDALAVPKPAGEDPAPPPREKLVIDLDRARALEDASWENTRRLLDALGSDAAADADPPEPEPASKTPASEALASKTPAPEVPAEPERSDTEGDDAPFASRLNETQAAVLAALQRDDTDAVRRICADAMTFPDAVYEEINEIALDALGDLLIDTGSGTVYEEYKTLVQQ
ncbi:MAG: TerB N-terminal domain-containing protein [Eubacteriales bacterium]|nr:TerB N-terminal domain-containing protein [Eubacteriales bacterium]